VKKNITIWRRKKVAMAVGLYGFLCVVFIVWDETLPLHLRLDTEAGGFGFSSNAIGLLLSTSGAAMLLFTSLVLPRLASGSKRALFFYGVLTALPVCFSYPSLAMLRQHVTMLRDHGSAVFLLLVGITVLKNICACISFTATMVFCQNVARNEDLGKVNGLGQSVAALARAFGPALGGAIWSLSLKSGFLFGNYILMASCLLMCIWLISMSPPSLDFKKGERKKKGNITDVVEAMGAH
jgi:hypothetical protein